MTRIRHCTACDGRDAAHHLDGDGRCRECQGVERPRRPKATGYVSPDDAERNAEAVDYAEARSRARVLQNAANNPGWSR